MKEELIVIMIVIELRKASRNGASQCYAGQEDRKETQMGEGKPRIGTDRNFYANGVELQSPVSRSARGARQGEMAHPPSPKVCGVTGKAQRHKGTKVGACGANLELGIGRQKPKTRRQISLTTSHWSLITNKAVEPTADAGRFPTSAGSAFSR